MDAFWKGFYYFVTEGERGAGKAAKAKRQVPLDAMVQ